MTTLPPIKQNLKNQIMGNYKKVLCITLSYLNNSEYLSFMNHLFDDLPIVYGGMDRPDEILEPASDDMIGAPSIGLSKEFVETFKKLKLEMADAVNESRVAQETEQAAIHGENRDRLASYITTRITGAGKLPLEAEHVSGKWLYKVIKPYIGIARLPVSQKTVEIRGLLIDLRKPENASHAKTLGLEIYMTELEKENNAYNELTKQRRESRAANQTESGGVLRERMNVYYEDLVLLAQSYNIAQPTESSTTFVNNLNQLISETVTAYNQRKKGSGGGGIPDRPDEI